jgi:hypothetical protein
LIYSSIHKKSILNYYDFSIGFWNYSVSVIFFVFTFYSPSRSDYCQSNFIQFAPIFVVSTKCIDPWVLECVFSNIIGDHQMRKLYFVGFLFSWFKWTTKSAKIRTTRLIMILQYISLLCAVLCLSEFHS